MRRGRGACGLERGDFFVGEDAAASQEPDAFRSFGGKSGASPRTDIDDELGVLTVFELRRADIKIAIRYLAQVYVLRTAPRTIPGSAKKRHRRGQSPRLLSRRVL
jgi:hypothetical protein